MKNPHFSAGQLHVAMFGQKEAVGNRSGGIEVVVAELSKRMAKSGNIVTCFNRSVCWCDKDKKNRKKIKEYEGVRQKYVPTVNRRGMAAVTSSLFAALFSSFGNFDVVHIHAEGPAFFCWIPKLAGKRVIVTIHGLDHKRAKWGKMASKYILQGERNAVRFADEIIVLSLNMQHYFKEKYGRETVYIPNGVNRPTIRKANLITKLYGLKKDSYVLYLGRIVPEKGIQYLIQAYKKVHTDKKLIIAGASSDSDFFLEKLKKCAADDSRIIFTGFVQGKLLEELYSNSYIFCLPSDLEGMPLSLLEAMSYGNCCLVSDIPECADIVADKAVVFGRTDINMLSEALNLLCDRPEIVRNYREKVAGYIFEKYDWDTITTHTVALYRGRLSYEDSFYKQIPVSQRWQ